MPTTRQVPPPATRTASPAGGGDARGRHPPGSVPGSLAASREFVVAAPAKLIVLSGGPSQAFAGQYRKGRAGRADGKVSCSPASILKYSRYSSSEREAIGAMSTNSSSSRRGRFPANRPCAPADGKMHTCLAARDSDATDATGGVRERAPIIVRPSWDLQADPCAPACRDPIETAPRRSRTETGLPWKWYNQLLNFSWREAIGLPTSRDMKLRRISHGPGEFLDGNVPCRGGICSRSDFPDWSGWVCQDCWPGKPRPEQTGRPGGLAR